MKIEEFEQIIADNPHKLDIIRLINEGIALAGYKTPSDEPCRNGLCHRESTQRMSSYQPSMPRGDRSVPHYPLCSIHDCHNISHVRRSCFSDNPIHVQNSLSPVSSISPWHLGQVFISQILILSLPHCKQRRPTSLR